MSETPAITTRHTVIPSPIPSAPSFHFHLTRLKDTLFVWIGTGKPTSITLSSQQQRDESSGSGAAGLMPGEAALDDRRLASDWAVAMPGRGNIPVTSTSVFRPQSSDVALPMSTRLGRKFAPNQIHLSLSLPESLTAQSGPALDSYASRTLLVMEKELVRWLGEVLQQEP